LSDTGDRSSRYARRLLRAWLRQDRELLREETLLIHKSQPEAGSTVELERMELLEAIAEALNRNLLVLNLGTENPRDANRSLLQLLKHMVRHSSQSAPRTTPSGSGSQQTASVPH
jgi:hypothetical protein